MTSGVGKSERPLPVVQRELREAKLSRTEAAVVAVAAVAFGFFGGIFAVALHGYGSGLSHTLAVAIPGGLAGTAGLVAGVAAGVFFHKLGKVGELETEEARLNPRPTRQPPEEPEDPHAETLEQKAERESNEQSYGNFSAR